MITGEDIVAQRRAAIRILNPTQVIPSGQLHTRVPLAPLERLCSELNRSGKLAPGLKCHPVHLVVRAVSRALERHPAFLDNLLPGRKVLHPDKPLIGLTVDVEGFQGMTVLGNSSSRPLEDLVQRTAAAAVEKQKGVLKGVRGLMQFRRNHRVAHWILYSGIGVPLDFLRLHVPSFFKWFRQNVYASGHLNVVDAMALGVSAIADNMLVGESAHVLVSGPVTGYDASGTPTGLLSIGIGFDLRLFEAYEAAALLSEVALLLAEPDQSLR